MIKSLAAIHTNKNKDLSLDFINIPDPKKDQVIVKNISSALCGSQLINISRTPVSPELLGHEAVAKVIKIGKNVKNFKIGEEVYVSWVPSKASKNNNYLEYSEVFWGKKLIKSVIFSWSEFSILHKQFIHKKDKRINSIYSSVLGCAGITGFGSVQKYKSYIKNKRVCIIGFGGIGSFIADACNHFGASKIDVIEKNIKKKKNFYQFKIDNFFLGFNKLQNSYDVVFDTVGNQKSIMQALNISKNCIPGYDVGGKIILIGFPDNDYEFSFRNLLMQEKTIIGCRGGNIKSKSFFNYIENLIIKKKLNLNKFVSDLYKFKNINKAISDLKSGKVSTRGVILF